MKITQSSYTTTVHVIDVAVEDRVIHFESEDECDCLLFAQIVESLNVRTAKEVRQIKAMMQNRNKSK